MEYLILNYGGKFQVYYKRIYDEVNSIKDEFSYSNLSKAFAHWYLDKFKTFSNQDICEALIDGYGDNGIDAVLYEENTVLLYQFKFPDKVTNIDKAIDEKTVLKLINGYNKLTSVRKPKVTNELFLDHWGKIKDKDIFNYKFVFVSYTDGFSCSADEAMNTYIFKIKEKTGNEISSKIINKKHICDLVDKLQKRSITNIELRYSRLDPSYNIESIANSWVGFTSAQNVLSACSSAMDVIFDENIRLYEGNVPVNEGIKHTASSEDSQFFYFFHNGIVFICDKCQNSTGNQKASLTAASVVNGCQTIVSLKKILDNKMLKDDVYIPIRIIETDDFDLRAKITEYLNSQSKIKDSYFLANNTFIKELQLDLSKKGYFLERLANEYNYKIGLNKIQEYNKDRIFTLEKAIQVYIAYYDNEHASIAKRGKSELFNREHIDSLITSISADRVLEAFKYYNSICEKITLYRKCHRSKEQNKNFLSYLGIVPSSENEYNSLMHEYLFMNSGDLLLLNTFHNLKNNITLKSRSDDEIIRLAISICKDFVNKDPSILPSAATKNQSIFKSVQDFCEVKKF